MRRLTFTSFLHLPWFYSKDGCRPPFQNPVTPMIPLIFWDYLFSKITWFFFPICTMPPPSEFVRLSIGSYVLLMTRPCPEQNLVHWKLVATNVSHYRITVSSWQRKPYVALGPSANLILKIVQCYYPCLAIKGIWCALYIDKMQVWCWALTINFEIHIWDHSDARY